jgi:hypothetical protein
MTFACETMLMGRRSLANESLAFRGPERFRHAVTLKNGETHVFVKEAHAAYEVFKAGDGHVVRSIVAPDDPFDDHPIVGPCFEIGRGLSSLPFHLVGVDRSVADLRCDVNAGTTGAERVEAWVGVTTGLPQKIVVKSVNGTVHETVIYGGPGIKTVDVSLPLALFERKYAFTGMSFKPPSDVELQEPWFVPGSRIEGSLKNGDDTVIPMSWSYNELLALNGGSKVLSVHQLLDYAQRKASRLHIKTSAASGIDASKKRLTSAALSLFVLIGLLFVTGIIGIAYLTYSKRRN